MVWPVINAAKEGPSLQAERRGRSTGTNVGADGARPWFCNGFNMVRVDEIMCRPIVISKFPPTPVVFRLIVYLLAQVILARVGC